MYISMYITPTWIKSSVSRSTAAVASSSTRTLVLRSRARAKQTNWRWPTDRFSPPSAISWFRPAAKLFTKDLRCDSSRAFQISSSVLISKGSKLMRSEPEKSTGSWGIIVRRERNMCRPIEAMSTPSMEMRPPAASIILNANQELMMIT